MVSFAAGMFDEPDVIEFMQCANEPCPNLQPPFFNFLLTLLRATPVFLHMSLFPFSSAASPCQRIACSFCASRTTVNDSNQSNTLIIFPLSR